MKYLEVRVKVKMDLIKKLTAVVAGTAVVAYLAAGFTSDEARAARIAVEPLRQQFEEVAYDAPHKSVTVNGNDSATAFDYDGALDRITDQRKKVLEGYGVISTGGWVAKSFNRGVVDTIEDNLLIFDPTPWN